MTVKRKEIQEHLEKLVDMLQSAHATAVVGGRRIDADVFVASIGIGLAYCVLLLKEEIEPQDPTDDMDGLLQAAIEASIKKTGEEE